MDDAIAAMNRKVLNGRVVAVHEAQWPRRSRRGTARPEAAITALDVEGSARECRGWWALVILPFSGPKLPWADLYLARRSPQLRPAVKQVLFHSPRKRAY